MKKGNGDEHNYDCDNEQDGADTEQGVTQVLGPASEVVGDDGIAAKAAQNADARSDCPATCECDSTKLGDVGDARQSVDGQNDGGDDPELELFTREFVHFGVEVLETRVEFLAAVGAQDSFGGGKLALQNGWKAKARTDLGTEEGERVEVNERGTWTTNSGANPEAGPVR